MKKEFFNYGYRGRRPLLFDNFCGSYVNCSILISICARGKMYNEIISNYRGVLDMYRLNDCFSNTLTTVKKKRLFATII